MIDKEQAIKIALDYITRGGTQLIDNPPILFEDEKRSLSYGCFFGGGVRSI